MELEIGPVGADGVGAFVETVSAAFGSRPGQEVLDAYAAAVERDRALAAYDGGRMVATLGAYTLELTVPGPGQVPVAGLTAVGTLPTHRRRGLLRALITRHLEDARRRGEVASALLASESAIYGRFGYGIATFRANVEIEAVRSAYAEPFDDPGTVELVDRGDAVGPFLEVFDRVRRDRVGEVDRSRERLEADLVELEQDAADRPRFYAVHRDADGRPDGFAHYTIAHGDWAARLARTRLELREVVAVDADVLAALWRFALDVDLVDRVSCDTVSVDDPLRWRLADPRRLRTTEVVDHLWLRPLDVPALLSRRTYTREGRVVLAVEDALFPDVAGRYLLEVGDGRGACGPTTAEPDLTLGVGALGSVSLGGVSFGHLAAAGRVAEHRPGAAAAADRLFAVSPAPFSSTAF